MLVQTRLIFTLYTVYGILFKGEFRASVGAPGVRVCACVCVSRRGW